jgi:ABC-2 type transport system ATP-binding protein
LVTLETPAVRCRGLVKRYPDVVAVAGLDLAVQRGECFGLLGPNGAGKTTAIEILEGLTEQDAGDVEVLGRRWHEDRAELRQRLGVQLQETQLNEKLTVEETLRLFRSFFAAGPTVAELLDIVELGAKRGSFVGKLSGGQKQRLAVACALAGRPELLFLDEPTTGLDPQSRRQLWTVLEGFRAAGGTILLTTHYMDEAQHLADRVIVLAGGEIVAEGAPDAVGGRHLLDAVISFRLPAGLRLEELPAGLPLDDDAPGGVVRVRTERPTEALHRLTTWAVERGLELDGLTVARPSLEDVYLQLTGADEQ